jgi:hypothetical protein
MKWVKLFENFDLGDEHIDKIKQIWKVDPLDFREVVLSCLDHADIYSGCDLTFVLWHPYPDSNLEIKPMFYLEDEVIKKGPWYENLESIVESERIKIGIEVIIPYFEIDRIDRFCEECNARFRRMGIPYMCANPDPFGESYLIEFDYTWRKSYLEK